ELSPVGSSPKGLHEVEHAGDGDETDRPNEHACCHASPKRRAAFAVDHGCNRATTAAPRIAPAATTRRGPISRAIRRLTVTRRHHQNQPSHARVLPTPDGRRRA